MDAVVDFLPSPLDIGDVKGYEVKNTEKKTKRKPEFSEAFSGYAFKIAMILLLADYFLRIYSGELKVGDSNP